MVPTTISTTKLTRSLVDPNEGKKNVERVMAVTADARGDGTGGGIMSDGKVNMVQRMYSPTPILLKWERT